MSNFIDTLALQSDIDTSLYVVERKLTAKSHSLVTDALLSAMSEEDIINSDVKFLNVDMMWLSPEHTQALYQDALQSDPLNPDKFHNLFAYIVQTATERKPRIHTKIGYVTLRRIEDEKYLIIAPLEGKQAQRLSNEGYALLDFLKKSNICNPDIARMPDKVKPELKLGVADSEWQAEPVKNYLGKILNKRAITFGKPELTPIE